LFFGSIDPHNFITVDKPPAALWLPDLSARLFGLSPWAVLLPQAVEGVVTVWLVYATVRKQATPAAGLVAGLVMALTPVATLIFRYNNPDALLVLLLVACAYAVTRAIEAGERRWVILAGSLLGFAVLTKLSQALLVVPAFALAFVLAAPGTLRQRVQRLVLATAALVFSAGWWIAAMSWIGPDSRPYVGGSQSNSFMSVMLGYNGLGRLTGNETGTSANTWSGAGSTRLFGDQMGTQVSWLLPAVLILSTALLWRRRCTRLSHPGNIALVIWGGWLLVGAATLSYAQGIVHAYYTVVLAPPIAALFGVGVVALWSHRPSRFSLATGLVVLALSTWWATSLLDRASYWMPWLRLAVVGVGVIGAMLLVAAGRDAGRTRAAAYGVGVSLVAVLMGPAAWSIQTATAAHHGADPMAGPPTGVVAFMLPAAQRRTIDANLRDHAHQAAMGGVSEMSRPSQPMIAAIKSAGTGVRWAAATVGGNDAAGLELATRLPILDLGGFNGTDPALTLEQFKQLVADGKVRYFVDDHGFPFPKSGPTPSAEKIANWVSERFPSQSFDGVRVYDLAR